MLSVRVRPLRFLHLALLAFCLLLPSGWASAEQPATVAAGGATEVPVSDAQLQDLLATLQDDARRQALIGHLQALVALRQEGAEAPEQGSAAVLFLEEQGAMLLEQLGGVRQNLTDVARVPAGVSDLADSPEERDRLLRALAEAGAALLVLLAVRWLAQRAIEPWRGRLAARGLGANRLHRAAVLLLRLAVDLLPVAAMAAVSAGIGALAPLSAAGAVMTMAMVAALLATATAATALRALLAPDTPALRLFRLEDRRARQAYGWLMAILRTLAWGYFAIGALTGLGLSGAARDGLLVLLAAAVALLATFAVLRGRAPMRHALRGPETAAAAPWRRWLAEAWHLLALLAIALYFVFAAADFEAGTLYVLTGMLLSAIIVVAAHLARGAIDRLGRRFDGHRRWLRTLLSAVQVAVLAIAAALLLEAWGVSTVSLLSSEFGRRALDASISIGLLIVGAALVWQVSSRLLERSLRHRTDAAGLSVQRSARLRTLLPLLRNAVLVVLIAFVTMMVLSELGVDIGPLLAGAGVLGLAIGFGAQTMVQDVITGLFIVIEDQVHIGDVVDTGGHSGAVEGMTIRTMKLRDLAGTLHIVPFSQVTAIQNMTKDYAYYVFNVGVAYREDIDAVIDELKLLGQELRSDPEYGALMLDDIEVLGLDEFADSAVVVKARIKTLPIKQWTIGREFNRRMKRRFDEKGIEIPFPHMTLYWGVDKEGNAPAAAVRLDRGAAPPVPTAKAAKPRRRRRRASAARTSMQRGDEAPESSTGTDDDD